MSAEDVFSKHQVAIDRAKAVGECRDVFGNSKQKRPCDDLATFQFLDCKSCPSREEC